MLSKLSLTFLSKVSPTKLRRTKAKFVYGASIEIPSYELPIDTETIKGLPSTLARITATDALKEGSDSEGPYTEIVVPDFFPPGSILVFETQMNDIDPTLDDFCKSQALEAFDELDLVDLNVLLHRCDGEEKDATGGYKTMTGRKEADLFCTQVVRLALIRYRVARWSIVDLKAG